MGIALPLVLAVFLSCCSLLAPEPKPVSNQQPTRPAEPTPIEITRNDQVTLLPNADGSVGSVVVRQDGHEIVLNRAYATAVVEGPGQIRQLIRDPAATRETFGTALGALPLPPVSFMLYFLKGEDELTSESKKEVEKVLAELTSRPAAEISVIGHTDTAGSAPFNDNLSLQRAKRVRRLLMTRSIPLDSIAIAGRGERELLIPTDDGVQEPRNRRVEIVVR